MKLARAGVLMGVGLLLPLAPWAARNWRTLHEVQFLAPRYAQMPGDFAPRGFDAWTATWLWRFRDVYLTQWNLELGGDSDRQIFRRRLSILRKNARAWRGCSTRTTTR